MLNNKSSIDDNKIAPRSSASFVCTPASLAAFLAPEKCKPVCQADMALPARVPPAALQTMIMAVTDANAGKVSNQHSAQLSTSDFGV